MHPITKSYDEYNNNGRWYMTVLTPLISSDSTKDVSINLFIKAGTDFEVAVPDKRGLVGQTILVRPYVIPVSAKGADALGADQETMLFGDLLSPSAVNNKSTVFLGERIYSFRSLMKRYEDIGTRITTDGCALREYASYNFYGNVYPPMRGIFDPAGLSGYWFANYLATTVPANFNNTALITYIGTSFLGTRGSIRYKFVTSLSGETPSVITGSRDAPPLNNFPQTSLNDLQSYNLATLPANRSGTLTDLSVPLWTGAVVQPGLTGQPGVEMEIPWYNKLRFTSTDTRGFGNILPTDETFDEQLEQKWGIKGEAIAPNQSSTFRGVLKTYVATGEDFTFCTYLGPPPVYVIDDPWIPTTLG
jgi:hypothetical protein